ncbi:hypothetical protein F4803DRAFT_549809 [Xylaria telfairii]|nr:hypothetical protein F4803DRAFT_549809 [Xylaria telfairii]
MHFTTLIAVFASTALASPQLNVRKDTAGIFGIFDDSNCSVNQRDMSDANGNCHELPGKSMKIWWLKKGCGVVTLNDRQCKNNAKFYDTWNECIDISKDYSWDIYCYP